MKSISQIAAEQNVSHTTVKRWLVKAEANHGPIGYMQDGKAKLYGAEAEALILNGVQRGSTGVQQQETSITVLQSSQCAALSAPDFSGLYSTQLNGVQPLFNDPMVVACQAIAVCEVIGDALDAETLKPGVQISSINEAARRLEVKTQELAHKKTLAQAAHILAAPQIQDANARLAEALATLQQFQAAPAVTSVPFPVAAKN
jgi:transposase-like protein